MMNKTKISKRMLLLLTAVLGFLFLCHEHPKEEDLPFFPSLSMCIDLSNQQKVGHHSYQA
jgi:hypothetical protein